MTSRLFKHQLGVVNRFRRNAHFFIGSWFKADGGALFEFNPATGSVIRDTSFVSGIGSKILNSTFSPNGEFLIVATEVTPFFMLYRRDDTTNKYTRINWDGATVPGATMPGFGTYRVSAVFSADGSKLLLGTWGTTAYLAMFSLRADGATFVKNYQVACAESGTETNSIALSPDGQIATIGIHGTGSSILNRVHVYKAGASSFTQLADIGLGSTAYGAAMQKWSKDGQYLFACTYDAANSLVVFKRNGDTLTRITSLNVAGGAVHFDLSPDETRIFMSVDGAAPYWCQIKWDVATQTLTRLSDPPALSGMAQWIKFSRDGKFVFVTWDISGTNVVKCKLFQRSGDVLTEIPVPLFTALADSTGQNAWNIGVGPQL